MMQESARLVTNLVGRKVHLLTDEEAREEARRQGNMAEAEIAQVTAATWFRGVTSYQKRFGTTQGEIVAVYLDKYNEVSYKVLFSGQIVVMNDDLFRVEPEATNETT